MPEKYLEPQEGASKPSDEQQAIAKLEKRLGRLEKFCDRMGEQVAKLTAEVAAKATNSSPTKEEQK